MTGGVLYDLFDALRQRDFALGIAEYLLLLDALQTGISSRAQLIFTCKLVWGKTPEEQAIIGQMADILLPPRFTPDDLDRLQLVAEDSDDRPEDFINADAEDTAATDRKPIVPPEQVISDSIEMRFQRSQTQDGYGVPLPSQPFLHYRPLDFQLDLPVKHRQMKQTWRYFRRPRRSGPPTELDIERTIEQMHRNGVLSELVLIPPRKNMARLLILKDEGGSMTPFNYLLHEVIQTAESSGLAEVKVCYYRNVPADVVYSTPALRRPVALMTLGQRFADSGILFISDGGAARGGLSPARAEATHAVLDTLNTFTQSIAWLNPVPQERWPHTTAELLAARVPMFPLNRQGLDRAVETLRGR